MKIKLNQPLFPTTNEPESDFAQRLAKLHATQCKFAGKLAISIYANEEKSLRLNIRLLGPKKYK